MLAVGRLVSLLHQVRHWLPHQDPPVHLQAGHRALRRGALRGRDQTNIFRNFISKPKIKILKFRKIPICLSLVRGRELRGAVRLLRGGDGDQEDTEGEGQEGEEEEDDLQLQETSGDQHRGQPAPASASQAEAENWRGWSQAEEAAIQQGKHL